MQTVRRALAVVAVSLAIAGCGSSQSPVDRLRSAIDGYNSSHPSTLAATGAACSKALSTLGATPTPSGTSGPDRAFDQAFAAAHDGFTDCVAGAASASYPLMAKADAEIAQANSWIAQADRAAH